MTRKRVKLFEYKLPIFDFDIPSGLDSNMNKNLTEAKKYSRQCRQLKKTYGGAYFELGVAELNLCNKSSGIKALKQAAKYDRRYRSEVKRIIKKIKPFMNHCE